MFLDLEVGSSTPSLGRQKDRQRAYSPAPADRWLRRVTAQVFVVKIQVQMLAKARHLVTQRQYNVD